MSATVEKQENYISLVSFICIKNHLQNSKCCHTSDIIYKYRLFLYYYFYLEMCIISIYIKTSMPTAEFLEIKRINLANATSLIVKSWKNELDCSIPKSFSVSLLNCNSLGDF